MAKTLPIPAAAGSEDIPVPEWHRRILDERMEAYRRIPRTGALGKRSTRISSGSFRTVGVQGKGKVSRPARMPALPGRYA
jgi:hypothetical protein